MGYTGTNLHPKYTMLANNHLKMKKHKDLLGDKFLTLLSYILNALNLGVKNCI